MSPTARQVHQGFGRRLANALEAVLPAGTEVIQTWSWRPARDEFIPDVMVHPRTEEDVRFTGMPLLAVEIFSTDRSNDLVLKTSSTRRSASRTTGSSTRRPAPSTRSCSLTASTSAPHW